ncbi:MAG: ABC transporter permease [Chloroflexota bacterium]|nr:ABC transporter permease [Chloroflexota bacterium]
MRIDYVLKRFGIFLIVVWAASTLNFFLPRLSTQNPIVDKLLSQAASSGYLQTGIDQMVKEYEAKFGLDKRLYVQYFTYIGDVLHLDFNYSIANYPRTVLSMMQDALPWTIGLLSVTTLLAFGLGTLLGALMAWPRAPTFFIAKFLFPPLLTFSAIPFYLLGLILVYFLSFRVQLFPTFGGYTVGTIPNWSSFGFWLDIAGHAVLPALSIVLGGIGSWAVGMRAMMVTTQGQDYMLFAEAKGLKGSTLFLRYAVRNALLPHVTGLALSLGQILSGAVLVEVVFSYPGIGTTLFHAIRENDYFTIQGIVLGIITALALAMFVLDLLYPMLDPRITYRKS